MMTLVCPAAATPMRGGADRPARGLHALDRAGAVEADAGHLAVLDDVDAERVGGARVAPGDRVVARGAAAALQRGAEHRVADVANVQQRAEALRLCGREPFVVDAGGAIGVHVALEDLHVVHRVRQHQDAARREHDVVVESLRQALPQLERMVVERGALREQVVGADDGGVAAGVAAADPALFEHRDAGRGGARSRGSRRLPARDRRRRR